MKRSQHRWLTSVALFVVVSAHALVATALSVNWANEPDHVGDAPIAVMLAMETFSEADQSQIEQQEVLPEPEPEPEPIVEPEPLPEPKPKPKPVKKEEKQEPVVAQERKEHIEAKQQEVAQANQIGASEQADKAKQLWYGQVSALLQRHKRYPRMALTRGQEGVVKVRFEVDSQGQLVSVEIIDSSGHRLLDKEALDLVKRVSPLPAPPAVATGEQFRLDVPVSFRVDQG